MDYFGMSSVFPVVIDNGRRMTEAEKEQLYFRYKDNHHDQAANRVLNSNILEDNVDSLLDLSILSSVDKNV
ncbi:hypothetical protein [Anaerosporobacter sp.]|uniref:hypothetical protein n=1 Tax=Anaerosporobacter sp. TaxID=1872529 RepID=UPI00286F1EDA|nr:hypothetical protein [Anaerosporobacter sp.]